MQKSIHSTPQLVLQRLLRTVRREVGLTQKELAARLESSHSRISDYERGGRRMDLVQLKVYCEAMGVDLNVFVERFLVECQKAEQSAESGAAFTTGPGLESPPT